MILKLTCTALAVVAAGVFAPISDAEACSPTYMPFLVHPPAQTGPDQLVLGLEGEFYSESVPSVSSAEGEILGTFERLEDLGVFTPDAPFALGSYIVGTIDNPEGEPFEVVEAVVPSTEIQISPRINHASDGSVCCDTEVECTNTCGCARCWSAGYTYTRALDVVVTTTQPVFVEVVLLDVDGPVTRGGVVVERMLSAVGGDLSAAETCVRVKVEALDGTEISSEDRCFDAADFPESDMAQPDAPEVVRSCAVPPDDTSDPNWQRYGTKSGAGCTVGAGGAFASWPLFLTGLLVWMRRRF